MIYDFYDSSFNGYPLCQSLDDPAVPVSAYPAAVTRAESTTYTDKKGVVSAEALNAMPLVRQAIQKLTEILNFTPPQRIEHFDAYLEVRTITKDDIKRQDGLLGLLGTQGTFAKDTIAAGQAVIPYTGQYATSRIQLTRLIGLYGQKNIADYAWETYPYPIVSAFNAGNIAKKINCHTKKEVNPHTGKTEYVATQQGNNLIQVVFATDQPKKPIVCYVNLQPIKKGEQLFAFYGSKYRFLS